MIQSGRWRTTGLAGGVENCHQDSFQYGYQSKNIAIAGTTMLVVYWLNQSGTDSGPVSLSAGLTVPLQGGENTKAGGGAINNNKKTITTI